MNTEQVTALVAGVPTILAAFTALVVALKGKKNTTALAAQTKAAFAAHLIMMHADDVKMTNPSDVPSTVNRYNDLSTSRVHRIVAKMEGKP